MNINLSKNKIIISFSIILTALACYLCSSCVPSVKENKTPKFPENINLTINFILPNYIYINKDELFYDFFNEFYNYIINKDGGTNHLLHNNINSVDDLYKICKTWDKKSATGLPYVGSVLGKYFLYQRKNSNFVEQKNYDYFVGHCLNNDRFVDFLYFAKTFFYHFRMDEGYTGSTEEGKDPYGSDFFASSYASIIDIAKFFYYTKDSLPSYFISKKNIPNLYDTIPGVLKNNFNKSITVSYNTKDNTSFVLPNNFDCYGFNFIGFYTNSNYDSEAVSHIDNDFIVNNNLLLEDNAITLYAKFERCGIFAEEFLNDFPN